MLRADWKFPFTPGEIAEAASRRMEYHEERMVFWGNAREEAKAAIEEKGFEVRDYAVTGGQRAEVVVDPALAQRLGEADRKLKEHNEKTEIYGGWFRVLERASNHPFCPDPLLLDHDDIRFFGLDVPPS